MAKILQNINGKLVPVTTIAQITGGGGGISEERVLTLIREQLATIEHPTWVGSTDIDPGEGSPAPENCPEGGLLITDVDDSDGSTRLVEIIRHVVNGMIGDQSPWVDYVDEDPGEGSTATNVAEKGLVIVGNAERDVLDLDQRIRDIVEAYGTIGGIGTGGNTTVINGMTEDEVDARIDDKLANIEHPVWVAKSDTLPDTPPANLASNGFILVGEGDAAIPLDDRIRNLMGELRYTIISKTPPGNEAPANLMNGGFYIYQP